jgi:hypothetical protein
MVKTTQSKIYESFGSWFGDLFVPDWLKTKAFPAAALGSSPLPFAQGSVGQTAPPSCIITGINCVHFSTTNKRAGEKGAFSSGAFIIRG